MSFLYGALFLIFAGIALLLASIGLYAVIAHSVSQRTQEIGIRTAMGATARDILTLVFKQGVGYDPAKLIESVRGIVGVR